MNDFITMVFRHEDERVIKKIGENSCVSIQKSEFEDFMENKISVDYTQNPNECVISISMESNLAKSILSQLEKVL